MTDPVRVALVPELRRPPDGPAGDPPVRPAATVMLVQDTPDGLEVFVLRRVLGMAFAGGMTAFPGGAVDASDRGFDHATDHATDPGSAQQSEQGTPLGWSGPDPQWWAEQLGVPRTAARALVVAAARELFEETGVLLAGPSAHGAGAGRHRAGRHGAGATATRPVTDADRVAVLDRRAQFAEVLSRADLDLRTDLLRPWANWITPPGHSRRYDTFFFVAVLPDGQQPRLLTSEADLGQWRAPGALLAEHDVGAVLLMPPTLAMLTDLAGAASVREVMSARRVVTPVRFDEPVAGADPRAIPAAAAGAAAAAGDETKRKGLS